MRSRRTQPDALHGAPRSQAQPQPSSIRRAPAAFRSDEKLYRILYEDSPVMYFTLDGRGTVLSVNRFGAEQLGYAAGELTGRSVLTVFHDEDKDAVRRQLAILLEQPGQARCWQLRKVRKDGTVMWVEEDARAVRREDGSLIVLVICSDISEFKKAEDELRENRQQYKLLVDHATDIIYRIDPNGYFTFVNPTSTRLMGYAESELLDHHFTEFIRPDYRAKAVRFYWRQVRRKTPATYFEFPALTKDGREIWFGQNVQLLEEDGRVTGLFSVTRDITDLRQAEDALRRSQEQLQSIWEISPAIMFIKDRQGRYLDVNAQFSKITPLPLEQVLGKTDEEIFPPPQAASFRANDLKVFRAGYPMEFEEIAEHEDGLHTSIVHKFPLRDQHGEPYTICGIVTDITERKRVEGIIRQSRDYYLKLLDDFPSPIWKSGPDAKCDYFNRSWLAFTGRTMDQERGDGWADGVHPEDLDRCVRTYLKAFHARTPFEMEYRLRRHDGEYRSIVDIGRPYYDPDGTFAGFLGSAYDITERKRAEQALAASERRLKTILEAEPECVKVVTEGCVLVDMNPAGLKMVEADRLEEIRGRSVLPLIAPAYRDAFAEFHRRVHAGQPGTMEFEIIGLKGRHRWVETRAVPLRNERKETTGVLAVTRDITERKRAEEALRVARQEHEQLARNLHDNIIQSIYALGFTLEECKDLLKGAPVEANRKLDRVIAELNRVIREVRGYLITPAGESETLSADELIASLQRLGSLMEHANSMRFTFAIDRAAADRLTPGQRAQLLYVAQEAMSNSLRHSGASTARVSLTSTPGGTRLEIQDSGVGFSLQGIRNGSGGLKNIRLRARRIGANLEIVSRPLEGTVISMEIPTHERHDIP